MLSIYKFFRSFKRFDLICNITHFSNELWAINFENLRNKILLEILHNHKYTLTISTIKRCLRLILVKTNYKNGNFKHFSSLCRHEPK